MTTFSVYQFSFRAGARDRWSEQRTCLVSHSQRTTTEPRCYATLNVSLAHAWPSLWCLLHFCGGPPCRETAYLHKNNNRWQFVLFSQPTDALLSPKIKTLFFFPHQMSTLHHPTTSANGTSWCWTWARRRKMRTWRETQRLTNSSSRSTRTAQMRSNEPWTNPLWVFCSMWLFTKGTPSERKKFIFIWSSYWFLLSLHSPLPWQRFRKHRALVMHLLSSNLSLPEPRCS